MKDYCTAVYSSSHSSNGEITIYNSIRGHFSRYGIALTRISDREALENPELLSDPFLLLDSAASVGWIQKMNTYFPSHRKITNQDINKVLPGVSTVFSANTENTHTCFSYLRQLGAKRIAFFGFDKKHFFSLSTIQTFFSLSQDMDIPIYSEDIYWNTDTLEHAAAQFLPRCCEYDALVTVNAGSAVFITQKLTACGVRIPEDIKIICMHDKKILSMMTPSITSFSVPDKELSMQLLYAYQFLKKHPSVRRIQIHVGSDFLPRASSGFVELMKNPSQFPTPTSILHIPESGHEKINPFITFFESCDKTDLEIIYGLMENKKKAELAEQVFLSPSTLTYRIQMILEKTNMKSTAELIGFLKDYHIL